MIETKTIITPLMQQYNALKADYPHAILLFRLGDFYEMFDNDAQKASNVLGLILTARQTTPMCGFPHHKLLNHVPKLLAAGYKVAICEQVGSPIEGEENKSKLFKREVVRLMTPGTIVENELLESKNSNYLLSLSMDIVGWGLAYIDVSTGEFYSTQNVNDPNFYQLTSLLSRVSPVEIISDEKTKEKLLKLNIVPAKTILTQIKNSSQLEPEGYKWSKGALWQNNRIALRAALNIIDYIKETQPGQKNTFEPVIFDPAVKLQLDDAAIKTLELVSNEYDDEKNTLWGVLDNSKTSMGSRQLRRWILEPLCDLRDILNRQNFVSFLCDKAEEREGLAEILAQIPDIERILGRVINLSATPRDVVAIRKALNQIPRLKILLSSAQFFNSAPEIAARIDSVSQTLQELRELLHNAVSDTPPVKLSDGGVIKTEYNGELDELRDVRKNSQSILMKLETKEREKTKIPSLKVGYNSIFGYYIEVTKTHLPKVPHYYTRKQTLVSAERFIIPELKEIESKILGAEERIHKLEVHLFGNIRAELLRKIKELRILSMCLCELDAFYSLSISALKGGYIKPEILSDGNIIIEEGRHPVVEKNLPSGTFVGNDLDIGGETQIAILTGPNMSGKSVYLRQNALITIMAQIGSFVPAKLAKIAIVDRIMTRIGSQDRMAKGESTFMVEMSEMSSILKLAGHKSLVLLDEVGRGTSTFDGISIAWAIVEYLYKPAPKGDEEKSEPGPKVLFATHYFELTELPQTFNGIRNFNVSAKEWTNSSGKTEVVFLHKIVPGPADKSYGIHVAQLAGLPDSCIERSKEILRELESKNYIEVKNTKRDVTPMLPIFSSHPVIDEIKMADPDNLTPIKALSLVAEWKKRLNGNK